VVGYILEEKLLAFFFGPGFECLAAPMRTFPVIAAVFKTLVVFFPQILLNILPLFLLAFRQPTLRLESFRRYAGSQSFRRSAFSPGWVIPNGKQKAQHQRP